VPRWGSAAATAAGEGFAWAAGRLAVRGPAARSVVPVVELVADGCDEFEEPSSAQAIPHVVTIAAPTPRATASPPTRPMHVEALIVLPDPRREKCCKHRHVPSPSAHHIHCVPHHTSGMHPLNGLFVICTVVRVCMLWRPIAVGRHTEVCNFASGSEGVVEVVVARIGRGVEFRGAWDVDQWRQEFERGHSTG
jgi:hypothetical protein